MALWLNHVAIATPRNTLTTHTVNPASDTAVAGTNFTPTAGRFLLLVIDGPPPPPHRPRPPRLDPGSLPSFHHRPVLLHPHRRRVRHHHLHP